MFRNSELPSEQNLENLADFPKSPSRPSTLTQKRKLNNKISVPFQLIPLENLNFSTMKRLPRHGKGKIIKEIDRRKCNQP